MQRHSICFATLIAVLVGISFPAHSERLVLSLSTHRVLINSSFTGAELVLFGAVERDAASATRRGGYDIIVQVTGPREKVVTRRKERMLGVWVNAESQSFENTPTYMAVLANKPLTSIAGPELLQRLQLGLNQMNPVKGDASDVFREALIRLNTEHGLYREDPSAVTFITDSRAQSTLFRTTIPLPANVPIGNYQVDVRLFADGAALAQQSSAIEIVKVGFEQFVANAAHEYGLLYGLAATSIALLTGWLASVVFRRD
ncbi:MAG TPA: TIGR02186 family protein [Xanthobacteraceae bacterium]|nr:TIGR02186 family protein [Xanthobacteraceae bacterium]